MPRHFLHLRDHVEELRDIDGVDLPGLDQLKKAVFEAARDVMAGDLKTGFMDFRYRIDAEDESGALIFSLPFQHAVNIIPPP